MKLFSGYRHKNKLPVILLLFFLPGVLRAQEPAEQYWLQSSLKKLNRVEELSVTQVRKMTAKTMKYLHRLEKAELKIAKKLEKKDSVAASRYRENISLQYQQMREKLQSGTGRSNFLQQAYQPQLDSLIAGAGFLASIKNTTGNAAQANSISQLEQLRDKLNITEKINQEISMRGKMIREQLESLGGLQYLKKFRKQAYYYQQQVHSFRELIADQNKLKRKFMDAVVKLPAFQRFFREHSQFASLFSNPGNTTAAPAFTGNLQTRTAVMGQVRATLGNGPGVQQALTQNLGEAQSLITEIKNKLTHAGGGGNTEMEMPGFKPNTQKTKSLFNRLEWGLNTASQKSRSLLPASSTFGVSLGYRINDQSVAGIGAAYKMGWGENIRRIKLSHEGLSLRSFIDYKIKNTFWLSGGAEFNYNSGFKTIEALKNQEMWQQSMLLGISKKITAGRKFNGKIQLLFDALHNRHVPASAPLLFRVGYQFK